MIVTILTVVATLTLIPVIIAILGTILMIALGTIIALKDAIMKG